jgi:hypothetical protein
VPYAVLFALVLSTVVRGSRDIAASVAGIRRAIRPPLRHHPADAVSRRLLFAVVGPQISATPSADGAAAAALDVAQNAPGLAALASKAFRVGAGGVDYAILLNLDRILRSDVRTRICTRSLKALPMSGLEILGVVLTVALLASMFWIWRSYV